MVLGEPAEDVVPIDPAILGNENVSEEIMDKRQRILRRNHYSYMNMLRLSRTLYLFVMQTQIHSGYYRKDDWAMKLIAIHPASDEEVTH
ncbi:hypothetical protein DPV78_011773 [Talaromyces pinophilus]|nr:hypothetical protein DPV78_011773 [Talaromyces pinophilus]